MSCQVIPYKEGSEVILSETKIHGLVLSLFSHSNHSSQLGNKVIKGQNIQNYTFEKAMKSNVPKV